MASSRIRTLVWAALGTAAGAVAVSSRKRRRYTLQDKVVLIAGGSRGLGLVLAREFSKRGCKVAVCARNDDELNRVREEFAPLGERFVAGRCDLRDNDEVGALIDAVEQRMGPIDLLVNCAGMIQVGPLEHMKLEDFRDAMDTNFWSAVHTTLAVYPRMQERRAGRIVNITSIGGKIPVPHLVPYSASKFALIGFSKGARVELKKDGICVTTVVPGLMRTGSPRNVDTAGKHRLEYSWFILSDSLPGVSMDARRAARKIIRACVSGKGEVTLGLPAKLIAKAEALAPNAFESLLAAANEWILPDPDKGNGDQNRKKKGFESENTWTTNFATRMTRKAERRNNQVPSPSQETQPASAQTSSTQSKSEVRFESSVNAEEVRELESQQPQVALMTPEETADLKHAAEVAYEWRVEAQAGKTPAQAEEQARQMESQNLAEREVLDNPQDASVRPVEPQCRQCGQTFPSEAELAEHVKTCKGGNDEGVRPHFH
jgi:NAD(P)-dependent dehydrogenase (short-subunit alcohol dehydrogenase family)